MNVKRVLILGVVVLFLTGGLFAGGGREEAPEDEISGTISFYTVISRQVAEDIVEGFERKYPRVRVSLFRSGTGEVLARLQSEIEAGHPQADVLNVADRMYFEQLADNGMLHRYIAPNAAFIGQEFIYRDGLFYDFSLMSVAIGYNTIQVTDPPTRWADLTDPKWRNRVGMPNPVYSGVALNNLATLVKNDDFGWAYYEALQRNGLRIFRGNPDVARAVADGEVHVGVAVYGNLLALKQAGSPVELLFPEEGAPMASMPVGIMDSSRNKAAAEAFVNYLLSEEGLGIYARGEGMGTTNLSVAPEGLDLTTLKIMPSPLEYIRDNRDELVRGFEAIFGPQ
jgi:iron(III) transport system substrate-binding protein